MTFPQSFQYQLYYHEPYYDAQHFYESYVPNYDGNMNPQIFLDLVNALEQNFASHNFVDEICIHYTRWKLVGSGTYYKIVLCDIHPLYHLLITLYVEMKEKLE